MFHALTFFVWQSAGGGPVTALQSRATGVSVSAYHTLTSLGCDAPRDVCTTVLAVSAAAVICQRMWGREELVMTDEKIEETEERTRGSTPRGIGGVECESSGVGSIDISISSSSSIISIIINHRVATACDQPPQHEADCFPPAAYATSQSHHVNHRVRTNGTTQMRVTPRVSNAMRKHVISCVSQNG